MYSEKCKVMARLGLPFKLKTKKTCDISRQGGFILPLPRNHWLRLGVTNWQLALLEKWDRRKLDGVTMDSNWIVMVI